MLSRILHLNQTPDHIFDQWRLQLWISTYRLLVIYPLNEVDGLLRVLSQSLLHVAKRLIRCVNLFLNITTEEL